MKRARLLVFVTILSLLSAALSPPPPAHADTEEALIIAGAATGAYVAVVLIGTALWRRSRSGQPAYALHPGTAGAPLPSDHAAPGGIGYECPQGAGAVTWFCW